MTEYESQPHVSEVGFEPTSRRDRSLRALGHGAGFRPDMTDPGEGVMCSSSDRAPGQQREVRK